MKISIKKSVALLAAVVFILIGTSCNKTGHNGHGVNQMEVADLIALYERDGYDEVYIVNKEGQEVAHYVLIDAEDTTSYEMPEGAVKLRVPLQNIVLDSEIYGQIIQELSASERIQGMFDVNYVSSPELKSRIENGKIADMGQTLNPNAEKILAASPDALLISYYDGMQTEGLDKLGVPVIKMFDLQETEPLGRAEWIRFIGRLVGKEDEAEAIFENVKEEYETLKKNTLQTSERPKVLTEVMYEGMWNVAGGNSYHANIIKDAGGDYFKKNDTTAVNYSLSPEQVLMEAGDADIWIIRYFGDKEQLKQILQADPVYREIKAYRDGKVYFTDTSRSGLFLEFPFHPQRLLKDYQAIFSGDSVAEMRYFEKLDLAK